MPSTKIINIQKGDSFEEIFDAVCGTDAQEVIFIIPKGTDFAKDETYFEQIARQAEADAKRISVMSSDPIICKLAANCGFDVMISSVSKPRIVTSTDEFETDEIAELAAYNSRKTMRDIVHNRPEKSLPVRKDEREFKIDINKSEPMEDDLPDIASVWSSGNRIGNSVKKKIKIKFKRAQIIGLATIGVIAIIGIYLYSTLAHATITIKPTKQDQNLSLKIIVSSNSDEVNYKTNQIPGQILSAQVQETGEFAVSGFKSVVQKSGGKITVYNKGSLEQRLVATTRFESSGGLVFRIPATITVPPAKKINGQMVSGSVETTVSADKAGKEYNIGPDQFTIPGFKGTDKFNDFYAESKAAMTGGFVGPTKIVMESDMTVAREALIKKAGDQAIKALRAQASDLKILDGVETNNEDMQFNAKVGEAADILRGQLNSKATAMAFRESDILDLIAKYLTDNGGLELLANKYSLDYSDTKSDLANKILTINLKITGTAIAKLDSAKIIGDIVGMNEDAIRGYFKDPKIESAKIILSPFWVKKVPKDSTRVELRINVD